MFFNADGRDGTIARNIKTVAWQLFVTVYMLIFGSVVDITFRLLQLVVHLLFTSQSQNN